MLKRLLTSTAILSVLAVGALAQTADQPAEPTVPPAPAPQAEAPDQGATDTTEAATAMPPPSEAIIPTQSADQVMADKLIGMTVYSSSGEQVGKVNDILVGKDGKVSGIVLSIGGFLGVGGKPVALTWQEVQLAPDEQTVLVSYTQDELAQAPEFKTKEELADEAASSAPPAPPPSQ